MRGKHRYLFLNIYTPSLCSRDHLSVLDFKIVLQIREFCVRNPCLLSNVSTVLNLCRLTQKCPQVFFYFFEFETEKCF